MPLTPFSALVNTGYAHVPIDARRWLAHRTEEEQRIVHAGGYIYGGRVNGTATSGD